MSDLARYRAKRRFAETPEPQGGAARGGELVFVVQKHAARRLHYDLRLQVGDTLKSWAVPQGPCLDPKVRRFAKMTEDHPLDYATFEGRIPAGNYGAGEMIVWDRGTWVSLEEPEAAIVKGELKFRLSGEKLSGGWMLKRLPDDPTNWILIKERDPSARPLDEYDVVKEAPQSALSGRTVEELRAQAEPAEKPKKPAPRKLKPTAIEGAVAAPFPKSCKPQLASPADVVPADKGWVHEIKFDGYRTLAFVEDGGVRLVTRNGLDWTKRYAPVAKALAALPCKGAVLDGEIVVQDARGVAHLDLLERALSDGRGEALTYFLFDLVWLDGYDLTKAPLTARKRALEALIAPLVEPRSPIQYSEHIEGDGAELFAHASRMGIEGVVSKRADGRYVQARSPHWLKVKRVDVAPFVVIGFTTNAPRCVAALILAEETRDGLRFAGKAGSGVSEARGRELYTLLSPHARAKPAISTARIAEPHVWIEPAFGVEIGHRGRTSADMPRQPVVMAVTPLEAKAPPAAHAKPRLVTDRDLAGVRLTNPEREIFAGSGVSKLDIALHYARVGDWALPEILRRPVTLIRCPTGAREDCFYQRHAFAGLPPGVETVRLKDEEGEGPYLTITEPRGYLALAQFGAIEFHLWGCRVDNPEHPDRLVFDLDPDEDLPWARVCDGAELLRDRLQALGVETFLRTTGGKGLHLVLALVPEAPWPLTKGFAEAVARSASADHPDLFLAVATKARRKGRIFVDYLRNGRGASAIASYSLRARPNFPVATPIAWSELRGLGGADAFDRKNIVNRLETLAADPWEGLSSSAVKITPKMRRAVGMKD